METLKTALVVVLLMAVLFGVYTVWNKDSAETPEFAKGWKQDPLNVEPGTPGGNTPPAPLPYPTGDGGSASAIPMPPQTLPDNHAGHFAKISDGPLGNGADQGFGNQTNISDAKKLPDPPSFGASYNSTTPNPPSTLNTEQQSATPLKEPKSIYTTGLSDTPKSATPSQESPTAAGNPIQASVGDANNANVAPANQLMPNNLVAKASDNGSVGGQTPTGSQTSGGIPSNTEFRPNRAFDNAWSSARAHIDRGKWTQALFTLSLFYHDEDLTGEERQKLIDLLDPLAGKVIYSTEHTLEKAYTVTAGDTLHEVARHYQVPMTLLQKINGVEDPNVLAPGSMLKVVRGPFRAEVDLGNSELVLFLNQYYAGRFPISLGNSPTPQAGLREVLDKQAGHEFVTPDGRRFPAGAPDNPYGSLWIDLGKGMSIHGSPDVPPSHGNLGSIILTQASIQDVFGILSIGSKVSVRERGQIRQARK